MAIEPPTDEAFNDWVLPSDVESLGADQSAARRWIWERARGGIARAFARSSYDSAGAGPFGFTLVPRTAWAKAVLRDNHFWDSGTLTFIYSAGPSGGDSKVELTFIDVRFDPAALGSSPCNPISRETEASPDNTPDARRDNLPDLPEAALLEWAKLFNAVNPGASEQVARKAINAMFPEHKVSQVRVRRVLPARRAGRPLKTKN